MSKYEEYIEQILQNEYINYTREYSFMNLKSKYNKLLRFDFAIFDENNNLLCLLEYDSELHFYFNNFLHKERKKFLKYQESDRIKNKYCLQNNIKLYRIPFYDFNKIKTLKDIFKKEYLVTNKWHNDNLRERCKNEIR